MERPYPAVLRRSTGCLFAASAAPAQSSVLAAGEVSGAQVGRWTLGGSPYEINDNPATVQAGTTPTIGPGVVARSNVQPQILIQGGLAVAGPSVSLDDASLDFDPGSTRTIHGARFFSQRTSGFGNTCIIVEDSSPRMRKARECGAIGSLGRRGRRGSGKPAPHDRGPDAWSCPAS